MSLSVALIDPTSVVNNNESHGLLSFFYDVDHSIISHSPFEADLSTMVFDANAFQGLTWSQGHHLSSPDLCFSRFYIGEV